jgi:hypothetical protein
MALSERHWHMISDMLEVYLDNVTSHLVLHIEPAFDAHYFSQLGLDASRVAQQGQIVKNIVLSTNCVEWKQSQAWSDFTECLLLPDLGNAKSWEVMFSKLQKYSFQLVIVNEKNAVKCLKERLSLIWEILNSHDFPYLLMLGTCVGAPTGVTLTAQRVEGNNHNDSSSHLSASASFSFSVLEDICSEQMWSDIGAVLYQRSDYQSISISSQALAGSGFGSGTGTAGILRLSTPHGKDYYAVGKRHQGHIISRRFRKTFTLLND